MTMTHRRIIRVLLAAVATLFAVVAAPLAAREREPNSVFAERRARLVAQLNGPVLLFGYTGKENSSPSYVFNQEENFYYLTGHNEEGAALLLLPSGAAEKGWKGAREILFLPPRDLEEEKWNGPRMGPGDEGVHEKTGFAVVEPFTNLKGSLGELAHAYREVWTLIPHADDTGYPHAREWSSWMKQAAPGIALTDVAPAIGAMRQIKSPGEIALLTKAIELSVDAQLDAMRTVRPGLYEYQVAARMVRDPRERRMRGRSLRAHRRHRLAFHDLAFQRARRSDSGWRCRSSRCGRAILGVHRRYHAHAARKRPLHAAPA